MANATSYLAAKITASVLLASTLLIGIPAYAQKAYGPGVTDTQIKLGQTMPYSGPVSAMGVVGKAMQAYFDKVNAEGGVNGRTIQLISLDDGYSPPKAVEQTRKLVEQDEVLAIFGTLGTPANAAVHSYLNGKKVPQLFIGSGLTKWGDPKKFPWTMGMNPTVYSESIVYARYILKSMPNAKIAVLYQNDDFGKDYLKGLEDGLGDKATKMIVARQSYEVSDPLVDSQIISLKASGADVLMSFTTPKFAAMTIKKVSDLNWKPTQFISNASSTVGQVLVPAGLEKSIGLITGAYTKDPTDPQWAKDPDMIEWKNWMAKYYPTGNNTDYFNVFGYMSAQLMTAVLKQAGDNLTRENILHQATSIRNMKSGMLLPGITMNTNPTDYFLIEQMQLARFDGKQWQLFGEVMGR